MGLLKDLIVTGASSLQGPVSFLGNERHNANSQYSASSNLYFAGGTTYFINNVGSAKFNTLTTTGSITVGTTAAIAGVTTIGGNTIIGAADDELKYANLIVHGKIAAHDINVDINGTSTSLKEYVSNGKDLVADAITDMGVATKTSATSTDGLPAEFSTLAENISKISPTVSSDTEIFVEITSCTWEGLTNTVIAEGRAGSIASANINGHNENTTHSDAEGTNTHTCTLTHDISGSGSWSGLTYTWGATSNVKNGNSKLSEKTKVEYFTLSHNIYGGGGWSQRGEDSSTYTWGAHSDLLDNNYKTLSGINTSTTTINLNMESSVYTLISKSVSLSSTEGYMNIISFGYIQVKDGTENDVVNHTPLLYKQVSGSEFTLNHTIEGSGSWNGLTYGWSSTSYVKEDDTEKTKVTSSGSTTLTHTISGSGSWNQRGQDSSTYTWSAESIVSEGNNELNRCSYIHNPLSLTLSYGGGAIIENANTSNNVGYISIASGGYSRVTDGEENNNSGAPLMFINHNKDILNKVSLTHTIEGSGSWSGINYSWSATSYVKNGNNEVTKVALSGSTDTGGNITSDYVVSNDKTFSSINAGRSVSGTLRTIPDYCYTVLYTNGFRTTSQVPSDATSRTDTTFTSTSGRYVSIKSVVGFHLSTNRELLVNASSFGNAEQRHVLAGKTFTSSGSGQVAGTGTMPDRSVVSTAGYYFKDTGNYAANMLTSLGCYTIYNTSGVSQGDHALFGIQTGYYGDNCAVIYPLNQFGNVHQSQVLQGYTFTSAYGVNITGTLTDRSNSTGYYSPVQIAANSANVYFYINTGAYLVASSTGYAEIVAGLDNFGSVSRDNVVSGKTFTSSAGYCVTGTMKEIYLYALYGDNVPMIKSGVYRLKINASGDYWYYKRSSNIVGAYSNGMGSTSYTETLSSSQALTITQTNSGACVSGHPYKKCARYNSSISLSAGKTYKIVFYLSAVSNSSVTSGYPLKCVVGMVTSSNTLVAYNSSTGDYMTWPVHSAKITTTGSTYVELTYTSSSSQSLYPALLLLSGKQTRSILGVAVYAID